MSVRVLSQVWDGYPGGGSELLALLALADWSDDQGRCFPSMAAIGAKTRLSADQARRVVHRLIDQGFVQVTAGKNGGGSSRRYQIDLQRLTPCMGATPGVGARGGMDASPPLAPVQGDPLHSYASRTVTYPSKTKEDASASVSPTAKTANPKKQIFDLGVSLLTQHGDSEKSARAFLGKYAKQDETKLAEILAYLATHPKVEPKSYIAAALKPKVRELAL